jgi:hypothetical protein
MARRHWMAAVALGAVALPLSPGSGSASADETRSCAWGLKVDPTGANVLFPDQAAHYWATQLPAVPGETLTLTGRFPHSRYLSFTSYDPALRSADGLSDVAIAPDPGSTNPFRVGADRQATRRSYTVHVVLGDRPTTPAPNTLYTGSTDGSRSHQAFSLIYRNYRQDAGYGDDGGSRLPDVAVTLPSGQSVPLPTCDEPTVPPNDVNDQVAAAAPPVGYPGLVGTDPPVWRKFYNLPTSAAYTVSTPYTGSAIGDTLSPATTATAPGGFADNPDNKYVATVVSSGLGDVAVIQATLPVTPQTFQGQRRMGDGQLRYWSMCSEEFASGRFYGCLVDDQVPLDHARTYTLMVSTAAHRPRNATTRCGVAWLPMGPAVDTVLLERNMLAAPGFRQSVQRARYGHEQTDLGAYYPRTRYLTVPQAQALGCKGDHR